MKNIMFRGVGTALVTPFDGNRRIDYASLKKIIDYQIDNDVGYLVILGSTGEAATILPSEKEKLINYASKIINKRKPLVVGIGGNHTEVVVTKIRQIKPEWKIDAILSASPHYNKPTQEGIYQHYKAIANATELPVILYNVPGRTASNIAASTTVRLAKDFNNIVAIKEASGNFGQLTEIMKYKPSDFQLISGDDPLTLPIISIGGTSVISVISNAYLRQFSQLVNSALEGDYIRARHRQNELYELMTTIFDEGSPTGIKAVLELKGFCKAHVRLPLVDASALLKQKLKKLMTKI